MYGLLPVQRLLVAGLAGCCLPVAAQVLISPVVVEMGARGRAAVVAVTLSDKAPLPVRLQSEVLRWKQDLLGRQVVAPTEELLVSPAVAELQPGQRQIFRVALRGNRAEPDELAYRLILEDVAEPVAEASGSAAMGISFRMRYDLPVLVAPAGKLVTSVRWRPCPDDASPPAAKTLPLESLSCIRLFNAGNRRIKVQTLTVTSKGWEQLLPFKNGETLLAHTEREWRVPLAPGQSGAPTSVKVETARGETLQAEAGGF